jgi:AcrR family transcriptional regulator
MVVMTFQRARTEEQREIRRRAILDTASAMLAEMPVAELTLNELSRRVGLAKPNVLRYFESREAVLLELLDGLLRDWLTELAEELATGVGDTLPAAGRAAALAGILSGSLSRRPMLCELFGAQGSVLEHNVSVEVVTRYKRASLDRLETMAGLVREHLPELGDDAVFCSLQTMLTAGALSAYRTPAPSLRAAYQAEPDLARLHLDPADYLRRAVLATLLGALPRP